MTILEENRTLKKTPLHDRHLALHGKMVDFGGWSLPIQYTSIIEEHLAVRNSCGFFDVSHLGELHLQGKEAFAFLQKRLTCDIAKCKPYRIIYGILCDDRGFALDDVLVYRGEAEDYYVIVNAANIQKDLDAFRAYAPPSLEIQNQSDEMACVAVQGPKSESILEKLFGFQLKDLVAYSFKSQEFAGERVWVSRSGYTGEDGFEIFSRNALAPKVWDKLINEGKALGAQPCGLGARNTLRLEVGNVLYGHELDEQSTPIEARVNFAVSFEKGDFVGRPALWEQKQNGTKKTLVGFKMLDRSIARDGYAVSKDGRKIGVVTSGSYAPSVGCGIGMAFIEPSFKEIGTKIQIELHGRMADAEIVRKPFVELKHRR